MKLNELHHFIPLKGWMHLMPRKIIMIIFPICIVIYVAIEHLLYNITYIAWFQFHKINQNRFHDSLSNRISKYNLMIGWILRFDQRSFTFNSVMVSCWHVNIFDLWKWTISSLIYYWNDNAIFNKPTMKRIVEQDFSLKINKRFKSRSTIDN